MSTDNASASGPVDVALDVAPGTEAEDLPLLDTDEESVDTYVRSPDGVETIDIGASAWDAEGVGIGGAQVRLSVSEAERVRDQLSELLEDLG
jgi:hypothetical protein